MSNTTGEHATVLDTTIGSVLVVYQDDRTAYVRAGTQDHGSALTLAETLDPLQLPRDIRAAVRGHFYRNGGSALWHPAKPASTYVSIHRTDGRASTGVQDRLIVSAITEALHAHTSTPAGQTMLTLAQAAKNRENGMARLEKAEELENLAEHLRDEATALGQPGSRVEYMTYRTTSGTSCNVAQVRRPDGELMPPPPPAPDLRSWSAAYRDWPRGIRLDTGETR